MIFNVIDLPRESSSWTCRVRQIRIPIEYREKLSRERPLAAGRYSSVWSSRTRPLLVSETRFTALANSGNEVIVTSNSVSPSPSKITTLAPGRSGNHQIYERSVEVLVWCIWLFVCSETEMVPACKECVALLPNGWSACISRSLESSWSNGNRRWTSSRSAWSDIPFNLAELFYLGILIRLCHGKAVRRSRLLVNTRWFADFRPLPGKSARIGRTWSTSV